MLIAQISDMHVKAEGELLYGRIDTAGFLERAVAHVGALDPRPDVVEARLGECDRPTILFMHHPPFDCGIDAFDNAKLNEGGERLADIVRKYDNVERVICGHVHRPIQVRWAGTMASIAASTAHQATLDLHDGAPLSMMMEPPGIALHLWRAGTGLVTHVSDIGTYDGPQSFRSTQ
jgi:3',5'-cyclic AMP phosphodiesterase CpdA